jgi:glucose/arabinose dehydrogenase/cytochrome c5
MTKPTPSPGISRLLLVLASCLLVSAAYAALPRPDPDNGGITLPPGFRAVVVADKLVGPTTGSLRFLAVAPNGDLYAKTNKAGIYALHDADGDGKADIIRLFGEGGGTGIALRDGWLYHSTNTAVLRYRYSPDELVPSGTPETIVTGLPAERNTHDAKSFAFDGPGRLLVEVGSPYNVYSETDRNRGAKGMDATELLRTHGGFWRFDPDRTGQQLKDGWHFSTGHRHSLALAWHPVSREFFMIQMGRDNLNIVAPEYYDDLDNAERVAEELHVLREGVNLGWPYSYWDPIKQTRMVAPEFGGDNRRREPNPAYDKPLIAFPAHWAPLQMALYDKAQFPSRYHNGMFVAFHGSWNRAPRTQAGYKIVFIPFNQEGFPTGAYETFADGFAGDENLVNPRQAHFRPGGLTVGADGSLYVGDTMKGRIWRIFYTGEDTASTPPVPAVAAPAVPLVDAQTPGGRIYVQVCAACHMPNGSGVPGMQPALAGSAVVAGDPARLLAVLLHGPAAALPADREKYSNVMPPFGGYSDAELASVATFLRKNFAPKSAVVTAEQVSAVRGASR